jgi:protein-tyrosine phosphatase
MTPEGLEVMRELGLDLGDHRSREATPVLVGGADLILGMAREHVRDAATLALEVVPRAFTLKELARRGAAIGPRGPEEPLPDWLARAAAGRRPLDLLGSSPDDDVPDPIGEPMSRYRAVADEIASASERLVNLAWPAGPRPRTGRSGDAEASAG